MSKGWDWWSVILRIWGDMKWNGRIMANWWDWLRGWKWWTVDILVWWSFDPGITISANWWKSTLDFYLAKLELELRNQQVDQYEMWIDKIKTTKDNHIELFKILRELYYFVWNMPAILSIIEQII